MLPRSTNVSDDYCLFVVSAAFSIVRVEAVPSSIVAWTTGDIDILRGCEEDIIRLSPPPPRIPPPVCCSCSLAVAVRDAGDATISISEELVLALKAISLPSSLRPKILYWLIVLLWALVCSSDEDVA